MMNTDVKLKKYQANSSHCNPQTTFVAVKGITVQTSRDDTVTNIHPLIHKSRTPLYICI